MYFSAIMLHLLFNQQIYGIFDNYRFFVNFGGKKVAYSWLKYLIVSTLISIIKVADVRIF